MSQIRRILMTPASLLDISVFYPELEGSFQHGLPHCYCLHHQIASCRFHAHEKQYTGHGVTPWPARGECSQCQKR